MLMMNVTATLSKILDLYRVYIDSAIELDIVSHALYTFHCITHMLYIPLNFSMSCVSTSETRNLPIFLPLQ